MWLGALALAKTGTPSLFEINPANIAFLQFWVKCAQTGLPFGLRVRVSDANDKNVANLVCVVFFLLFFLLFFFSFSFPCLYSCDDFINKAIYCALCVFYLSFSLHVAYTFFSLHSRK